MTSVSNSVLIVDDDPNVLDGLRRQLRGDFEVVFAQSAPSALEALERRADFSVIVSDMRMPEMSGVELLRRASQVSPLSVRMMLTGTNDLSTAIAAVNDGRIFRFLSKPCPIETLSSAIRAGIEQHRLLTAEKDLLERTLKGSVKVLAEVLALAHPSAFGRAERIRRLVLGLAQSLQLSDAWQLEVGAMLSQIGCVAIPEAMLARFAEDEDPTADEREMFDRHARIGATLIANIPRLECVSSMIAHQSARYDGCGSTVPGPIGASIPIGARLLKVANDYDRLTWHGASARKAISVLQGRTGWYDPAVLGALEGVVRAESTQRRQALSMCALRIGMIVVENIVNAKDVLLVGKGNEITHALLARLRIVAEQCPIREPIHVLTPGDK